MFLWFTDKQQDIDVPIYPPTLTNGEVQSAEESVITSNAENSKGNESFTLKDASGVPLRNNTSSSSGQIEVSAEDF